MNRLRVLAMRVIGLFSARRRDDELQDEIQTHLDLLGQEHLRRGRSPAEARAAARREFGGVDRVKERCRDQRGLPFADTIARDIRFALRMVVKHPGVAAAVILSLALGIGANTAIFSILNAAVLRSLPVPHPEHLFIVGVQAPFPAYQQQTYPMFERLRDAAPAPAVLAAMSTVAAMQGRLEGLRENARLNVQLVSGEFFSVVGLPPTRGRLLGPDDNRTAGGQPVAVISQRLWRGQFAGASDLVGRGLTLNGVHFTIVGIGPTEFSGVWLESPTDVWIPLVMQADVLYSQNFRADSADLAKPWMSQDSIWWLKLFTRTTQPRQTAASLNVAFQQAFAQRVAGIGDPDRRRQLLARRLTLDPFGPGMSNVRERLIAPLFVLMVMVALILLIACANGANLLLARAAARRREIAIRLSMGASRRQLVQQLLTESSILVGLATVLGVLIALWAGDALARQLVGVGGGAAALTVPLDWHVLTFAALVSIATGLLFGLAPALRTTNVDLGTATLSERKALGVGARLNATKCLVALQVAFSLWLVVGAGLFVRSFWNLTHLPLGFDADRVITAWINPRLGRYQESQMSSLNPRLIARVEALPGVRSASLAVCALVSGCRATSDVHIAGYQPGPGEMVQVQENHVSLRYFSTVGMRLVAGRDFDERDTESAPRVAVVNRSMARRYFPDGQAVGHRFGYEQPDVEIVGVVEDARVNSVPDAPSPMAFYPLGRSAYGFSLDVRAAGDPQSLMTAVRRAVAEVDPDLPVDRITMLSDQVGNTVTRERFVAGLTTLFGALALGLACIGLFGVMSYTVSRRTPEFGVRMALGARPVRVLWTVFRESLALVGLGLAVGVPTVVLASRALTPALAGIRGDDPVTLAGAVLLLVGVAAAAGLLPAWRAARVDPMVALRHE